MKYLEKSKENKNINPNESNILLTPKSDFKNTKISNKSINSPVINKYNRAFYEKIILPKKKLNFYETEQNNFNIDINNNFRKLINISDQLIQNDFTLNQTGSAFSSQFPNSNSKYYSSKESTFQGSHVSKLTSNFINESIPSFNRNLNSEEKSKNLNFSAKFASPSPSPCPKNKNNYNNNNNKKNNTNSFQTLRKFSDRFIPINKGQNLIEKFELLDDPFFLNKIKKNEDLNCYAFEFNLSLNSESNSEFNNNHFFSKQANSNQRRNYAALLRQNLFPIKTEIRNNKLINEMNCKNYNELEISQKKFEDYFAKKSYLLSPEKEENNENIYDNSYFGSKKIKSKLFEYKKEYVNESKFDLGISLRKKLNFNCDINLDFQIPQEKVRKLNSKPYRILDAPELSDDFYLNLLDWSSKDVIALGLENNVFLWCCKKMHASNLLNYPINEEEGIRKYVTSVIWNNSGTELAVGNTEGTVEIWDGNLN
jgi:cell division cycle 20-like protein 1 (cofactor of APC complex)